MAVFCLCLFLGEEKKDLFRMKRNMNSEKEKIFLFLFIERIERRNKLRWFFSLVAGVSYNTRKKK